MSKRKPNNNKARMERAMRAVLGSNRVAVVSIDPSGKQGLMHYRSCKSIPPSDKVATAVMDIAHRWTIYIAGLCVRQDGERYMKPTEVSTDGMYRAEHLTDVIDTCYRELLAGCNPQHLKASGWIAIPKAVSLTEEEADRIFEAAGAWDQQAE